MNAWKVSFIRSIDNTHRLTPYDIFELIVFIEVSSSESGAASAHAIAVRLIVFALLLALLPGLQRAGRSLFVVEQARLKARMSLQVRLGAVSSVDRRQMRPAIDRSWRRGCRASLHSYGSKRVIV